jgi:uncharacterized protein YndB with AHSA1/START domain
MSGQPDGFVLELECVVSAPPERVFELLTEPAELARWWGPHGFTIPSPEVDLRPGGGYRFVMVPADGDPFHLSGSFLEVDPPRRLTFSFAWEEPVPDDRETVVLLVLEGTAAGTRVRLSQGEFATEERLELHRGGWSESFEKLRELARPGTDR